MFTRWEKNVLSDLVHDEITRVRAQGWRDTDRVVSDLWGIIHKLDELEGE